MDAYELRSELNNIKNQLQNADLSENIFTNKELVDLTFKMIMVNEIREINKNLEKIRDMMPPRPPNYKRGRP